MLVNVFSKMERPAFWKGGHGMAVDTILGREREERVIEQRGRSLFEERGEETQ